MSRLQGQVAVVTGGAQGLGRALAERLANEGARVVIADLNAEGAKQAAAELPAGYGVGLDISDYEQCETVMSGVAAEYQRLDLLVCNAGIVIAQPAHEFAPEAWQKVINVNLIGYFHCVRAALPHMIRQNSGNIIQINSKSGKKGSAKNSAYAASKFGGIGLTQSLALELAEYGIRVNAICPGNLLDSPLWTDSLFDQYARNQGLTQAEVRERYLAQVPLGRSCRYEDVANVLVFLASEESSYMTGQAVNVTGGQEMR